MFLSLDGIDGAGKTTQIDMLSEWLRAEGRRVTTCRDPGGTPLGERLRELLLRDEPGTPIAMRAEMLLYMASRAQLVEQVIRPALAAGGVVISDRYLLANVVYQGHAGGLAVEQVRAVGLVATDALRPHATLVLDIDPAAAAARMRRPLDRMESRGVDYQRRLREGFLAEAARDPTLHVIEAARPAQAVHESIRAVVAPLM